MLKNLSYVEFDGEPKYWELRPSDFVGVNLIVGKNATGKSRLINVIGGLCRIISGQHTEPFSSGRYDAKFDIEGKEYVLKIEFNHGRVAREWLSVDGVEKFFRGEDGIGKVFYERESVFIDFQVDESVIAIQQRKDKIQHPFIVAISDWADRHQTIPFTALPQNLVIPISALESTEANDKKVKSQNDNAVHAYHDAYKKHGKPLDEAIIRDMKCLGYDLLDVGTADIRGFLGVVNLAEPLVGLFAVESGHQLPLIQHQMSQGMFRALSVIVHLNCADFSMGRTLLLIDDIGEGLDYERSSNLIDVLIRHSERTGVQIIMTSNDRFVMNRVPLENWSLLRRNGSVVQAFTERNSREEFESFRFIGLSNFDFFTSAKFEKNL